MSRIGDRHTQEVLFQSIYMSSTALASDSGQLCIYYYSQNIEKKIGQVTLGPLISVKIYSVLVVLSWFIAG